MYFYVNEFIGKKKTGLLVLSKQDLVDSTPHDTLSRIVSANPIRSAPSFKCPLSEMTLAKLVAEVRQQHSVITSLFSQRPPQYLAACNIIHMLSVIANAVSHEMVNEILKATNHVLGHHIRSLFERIHDAMEKRDFDRLYTEMMNMKNCLDALKSNSVLKEFYQEVDAKKKELCRSVTQIANEARAAFFPAHGEWTPSDTQHEKDHLQTLQKIEEEILGMP